jgi:hypothetical protein
LPISETCEEKVRIALNRPRRAPTRMTEPMTVQFLSASNSSQN